MYSVLRRYSDRMFQLYQIQNSYITCLPCRSFLQVPLISSQYDPVDQNSIELLKFGWGRCLQCSRPEIYKIRLGRIMQLNVREWVWHRTRLSLQSRFDYELNQFKFVRTSSVHLYCESLWISLIQLFNKVTFPSGVCIVLLVKHHFTGCNKNKS